MFLYTSHNYKKRRFFKLSSSVFKLQTTLLLTKLAPIMYFGSKYLRTQEAILKNVENQMLLLIGIRHKAT